MKPGKKLTDSTLESGEFKRTLISGGILSEIGLISTVSAYISRRVSSLGLLLLCFKVSGQLAVQCLLSSMFFMTEDG
jgi:small-conductance mechanosensitive channel